jgi:hypothetical protein
MNNIDLVKALHQIWNTGDLALIDSVYAHDFLAHWPASSEIPERRALKVFISASGGSEPRSPIGMNKW